MRFLLILLLVLAALPAHAQTAEEAAVLVPIHAMMRGMEARDPAAMLAVIQLGGVATGFGCGPDGKYDSIYSRPMSDFVEGMRDAPPGMTQEFFDPEVRIDRNLATVWVRYVFSMAGKFSNQGYESYQLVRVGGNWKIFNYSWSTQPEECPAP